MESISAVLDELYGGSLEPMVRKICLLWLRLHGFDSGLFIDWLDINLQDIVEEAKAQLYLAQAEHIRKEQL